MLGVERIGVDTLTLYASNSDYKLNTLFPQGKFFSNIFDTSLEIWVIDCITAGYSMSLLIMFCACVCAFMPIHACVFARVKASCPVICWLFVALDRFFPNRLTNLLELENFVFETKEFVVLNFSAISFTCS